MNDTTRSVLAMFAGIFTLCGVWWPLPFAMLVVASMRSDDELTTIIVTGTRFPDVSRRLSAPKRQTRTITQGKS